MEAAKKRVAELERQRRELYAQQQQQEREARQEELAIRFVLHTDLCWYCASMGHCLPVSWKLLCHAVGAFHACQVMSD